MERFTDIKLYPWQRWLAIHALELKPNGFPRFRTIVVLVARQNGKSTFLQLLNLFAMYALGLKLVIGTAQNLDTAEEVWEGAIELAQAHPELDSEISNVARVNGKKALKLKSGERYKIAAATRRAGRGLTAELIDLDELREHQSFEAWSAITKTTRARAWAIIMCFSNAGDRTSVVLAHLRRVAHAALGDPDGFVADSEVADKKAGSVGIFEWSAEPGCDLEDRVGWQYANPSMGYSELSEDTILTELETDLENDFRTEVLCQWVDTITDSDDELNLTTWLRCQDDDKFVGGKITIGIDAAPWSASASIVAVSDSETPVIELVARRRGVEWLIPKLQRMRDVGGEFNVAVDPNGPIGALLPRLHDSGLTIIELPTRDVSRSLGALSLAVVGQKITHRGQPEFDTAVHGAKIKNLGDSLKLSRTDSTVDITPLKAAANALWISTTTQVVDYNILESIY